MGKWKYVNLLVIIVILGFMYRYFYVRYQASVMVYVLATAGTLLTAAIGYYIFVYRIKRKKPGNSSGVNNRNNKGTKNIKRPDMPPGGRPRVVLKKGRDGTDK